MTRIWDSVWRPRVKYAKVRSALSAQRQIVIQASASAWVYSGMTSHAESDPLLGTLSDRDESSSNALDRHVGVSSFVDQVQCFDDPPYFHLTSVFPSIPRRGSKMENYSIMCHATNANLVREGATTSFIFALLKLILGSLSAGLMICDRVIGTG